MRFLYVCLALSFLILALPVDAAKVKVWHQHTQSHYDKAKFKDAVVTSEGVLRLSRQVKLFANIEAANIWDLAEDKNGNLYVATGGDEGKLYKVTPAGKTSVVYTSKDSHIFCLAATPDGTIYAGTGPTGKLLRVTSDGKVTTAADDLDSYVWSLAYDADSKSVYAGTGPKGKIYRLPAAGKTEVFYTTKQEHILCLALGDKGTLYAGTDKGGLIYRINSAGKGFVLYHANQPEVRALLVTPDAVYAGTSAPIARKGSFGPGTKFDDTRPSSPAPGENSLYRIANDGSVRELYRDKTMILRLGQNHGKLLVATGMQGQLFEVNEATKEKTEIARLDVGQIHCLLQRRDGSIVLGTGDPGKLYVLDDRFAAKGTVLSEVLDTKIQSKWGAMTWKSDTPAGTAVSIAVRSGNVAEPDDTWSAWSAEQASADTKAQAPLGRYLQYRVTLTSENAKATSEFRQFALRYQTINQAPELTNLDVPDLDTKDLDNPKKLKIKWTATDPNDDELTFSIYCKKEGWKDWVLLEENHDKSNYDWDTASMPSGVYQIKVVASDRKDNAAEDALTAERVSAPVPVTHLPPSVTVKVVGFENGQAVVEATATDPFVRLTEASFAVDGKRWTNVFPTDGLFDSKTESFRFKTDALRAGTHVLVLRVRNAAGTFGSGDAVILRKE
jgi:sugar lactone lactonase YvrE